MDKLNRYITFRYKNWLDYARHMARVHKFEGWDEDLLNDVILDLLSKDKQLLTGLMERTTKKIVNGEPTTELDKFVLRMLHLNAFSPVAPFRKNTIGNKIIARGPGNSVEVKRDTELNGHDCPDELYSDELHNRLDEMHQHNMERMVKNGFNSDALLLYTHHFIFNTPIDYLTDQEKEYIESIKTLLTTKKTLWDD